MKYFRNGEHLSCTAKYVNNEIVEIVCFSEWSDTILIDECIGGRRFGMSRRWYDSGNIMMYGRYENNARIGIWHEYYENSQIYRYNYYRIVDGLSQLYYQKTYDTEGELYTLIYPLEYRTNSDSLYKVNVSYQLFVDLMYSEFDSVNVAGIISEVWGTEVLQDTVKYFGNSLYYEFSPINKGINYIEGVLIELNASAPESSPEHYGGERPFKFQYEAVK